MKKSKKIILAILIATICCVVFSFQTQKVGFHEDEGYTAASSVNPSNGLMVATDENGNPKWLTKEYVTDFVTLSPKNIFNFKALYLNQAYDNHPPFFYTMVHFASLFFGGHFTKYNVFIVNIVAFILSLIVIIKILKLLSKEKLIPAALIFYGLSMGTISMVIFQRMYMLLTFFVVLYFYQTLKIYKNNFKLDGKTITLLGITTILGFLTQYFFAIYAFAIFVLMIIQMFRRKANKELIKNYFLAHVIYAILGILIFVPCIKHLLFSDRGISNLGNGEYFLHFWKYIKHFAYAFSINTNYTPLIIIALVIFFGLIIYWFIKSKEKFIVALTTLPSIFYFIIAVKMTSFQELRYIMPTLPFASLAFILSLDNLFTLKNKENIITIIATILVFIGLFTSKPLFLYKDYQKCLDIAKQNSEKSFVYVYDNFFNHMQSIPEMMVYKKTLIVNTNGNNELEFMLKNDELNNESSYILSIKNYMDNDEILNKIKENTDFKNIEKIYEGPTSKYEVGNNLYLVSK